VLGLEDGEENHDVSERSTPPSLTPYMPPSPLSHKMEVDEHKIIALGGGCSAVVQHKLPTKLKDPNSFSIPCLIRNMSIDRALCDFGSSVSLMPYFLFKRLT